MPVMSRRKQSNPKPIKRLAGEGENGDVEMTEQLQPSGEDNDEKDQSNSGNTSEAEAEPVETDQREITNSEEGLPEQEPVQNNGKLRKADALECLHVPTELLTLEKVDKLEYARTGVSWSISAAVPLPKGISIGPYEGEHVALSSIKQEELVLPFQSGAGDFVFVKVTEPSGTWLSHLKPAENPSSHNTSVFFEAGRIWCEILSDVEAGTTLVASFAMKPGSIKPLREKPAEDIKIEAETALVGEHREIKDGKSVIQTKADHRQLSPSHVALIFHCPFCGVRFSSPRTLEAHLTYYCSKKPPDFVSIQQLQQRATTQLAPADTSEPQPRPNSQDKYESDTGDQTPEAHRSNGVKRPLKDKSPESDDSSDVDAPKPKSPKTGQVFKCGLCEYTADKISSLNRHRRIHNRVGDSTLPGEGLSVSPVCQSETFCKDCNIQFSSFSTYRGHKEFYCKHRLSQPSSKSDDSVSDGGTPTLHLSPNSAALHMSLPTPLLVTTNGQLGPNVGPVHPAMLLGKMEGADPVSSHLLLQAMNKDIHNSMFKASAATAQKSPEMSASLSQELKKDIDSNRQSRSSNGEDLPLDLSCSKSKSSSDHGERSESSMSETVYGQYNHQKSVLVKNEPHSPSESRSMEGSHSDGSRSAEGGDDGQRIRTPKGATAIPLNIPTPLPLMKPGGKIQYVKNKPIPPLQLVSRCVECNIVFYKHENYLIHKEHYCSGRRSKDSPELSTSPEADSGKEQSDDVQARIRSSTSQSNKTADISEELKQKSPSPRNRSPPQQQQQQLPPKKQAPGIVQLPNEICYRFYCIPCKIKFSSAGTLKAHKEYYCPHGKDNEQTLIVKEAMDKENDSSSASKNSDSYKCENCGNEFVSARLLKLHLCSGLNTETSLLRCPYCDYVTQTENRLSEHMKVHVSTKAFKCTICGYRGNTPRGMRMHGKMHIDNGESFTDEHMREYEEPPLVPIQRNGMCDKGPVDVETELIRMKNEPYKRRRSRKSFEKSENLASFIGHPILPHVCAACGQAFADVNAFALHLRMHEMAAVEAAKILKCAHCTYVADSLTSLLVHMQENHPEHLPGTSKPEQSSPSGSESGRSRSQESQRSRSNGERANSVESSTASNGIDHYDGQVNGHLTIKTEPDENSVSDFHRPKGQPLPCPDVLHSSSSSNKSPPAISPVKRTSFSPSSRSESSLDLTKSQSQNHVKQSLSPKESDIDNKQNHLSEYAGRVNGTSLRSPSVPPALQPVQRLHSPQLPQVKSEPVSPSPSQARFSPGSKYPIKPEPVSPSINKQSSLKSPNKSNHSTPSQSPRPVTPLGPVLSPKIQNLPLIYSPQQMISLYQLPPGVTTSPQLLAMNHGIGTTSPTSLSPGSMDKSGRKYCRHCDINFTYLSSFLTHKKYYCSARPSSSEELSPSATA